MSKKETEKWYVIIAIASNLKRIIDFHSNYILQLNDWKHERTQWKNNEWNKVKFFKHKTCLVEMILNSVKKPHSICLTLGM